MKTKIKTIIAIAFFAILLTVQSCTKIKADEPNPVSINESASITAPSLFRQIDDTTNLVRAVQYQGTFASFLEIVEWAQLYSLPDSQLWYTGSGKFRHFVPPANYGTVNSLNYLIYDLDGPYFYAQKANIFLGTFELVP